MFRQFSDTERRKYATDNGWKFAPDESTGQNHAIPFRFDYVEDDSPSSVTEDFANNIEYFLFNPQRLMKVAPSTHNWIRTRFGDRFRVGKGAKK
jgi:hypothetical protein